MYTNAVSTFGYMYSYMKLCNIKVISYEDILEGGIGLAYEVPYHSLTRH